MKSISSFVGPRFRQLSPLAAVLVSSMLLAACGGGSAAPTSSSGTTTAAAGPIVRGGTLTLATADAPATLDPRTCPCANGSIQIMLQVFDQLVEYLPGSIEPQPGLATSWTVSPDGLRYTFHLRAARFSNGQPVTVGDVTWSLQNASSSKAPYGFLYANIKRILTPSPSTVALELSKPTPALIYSLGIESASILPRSVVMREGDAKFGAAPVGSGAFEVTRYAPGQEVDLKPNPYYWRHGQPYLSGVHILYIPNDNTRILSLESGSIDAADQIPFNQVATVNASGQAHVLVQPSSAIEAVWFNEATSKPLASTAVRQALYYATPVAQIAKVVFAGLAPIANTGYPKLKYWTSAVHGYPYDIARAKALLASTPYRDGFPLSLSIVGTDVASTDIAQVLQSDWAKLGVTVHIQQYDFGTLNTRVVNGQTQAALFLPDADTSDIPVDDEFALQQYDSPSEKNFFTSYNNPTATSLAARAVSTNSDATRAKLFAELQQQSVTDPQNIPLVYTPYRVGVRSNVHGLSYVLTGWWRLEDVWLSH